MAYTDPGAPAPSPSDIDDARQRLMDIRAILQSIARMAASDHVINHMAHMGAAISEEVCNDLGA